MLDSIATLLIALGCFLGLIGGLGVIRLPDFYSRLHAVGITDTMCSFFILSGLVIHSGYSLATVKLLFVFLFLLFTSPASSFALANSAWKWGLKPRKDEQHIRQQDDE